MNEVHVYEEQIIATLLTNPELVGDVTELSPDDFSHPTSRAYFASLLDVNLRGDTPDIVNVAEGVSFGNAMEDLSHLCQRNLSNPANLLNYVGIVQDSANRAREVHAAKRFAEQVSRGDQSALSNLLATFEDSKPGEHYSSIQDSLSASVQHADKLYSGEVAPGIPTGVSRLDEKLGGLHQPDLVILAARPAMGKTAVMMNLALNSGVPCAVFSAEQGHRELTDRAVAITGKINLAKFRNGRFEDDDWPRMVSAASSIQPLPIHYYAPPVVSIDDLCRQAMHYKTRHGIRLIFVDYLQRIRIGKGENRNLEVGEISWRLKSLAKQLEVPVVALSQLNRKCEERSNKRPVMSDLKESGDIEQDADVIVSLYREGVYNKSVRDDVIEFGVLKNRHGPIGTAYAGWEKECVSLAEFKGKQY